MHFGWHALLKKHNAPPLLTCFTSCWHAVLAATSEHQRGSAVMTASSNSSPLVRWVISWDNTKRLLTTWKNRIAERWELGNRDAPRERRVQQYARFEEQAAKPQKKERKGFSFSFFPPFFFFFFHGLHDAVTVADVASWHLGPCISLQLCLCCRSQLCCSSVAPPLQRCCDRALIAERPQT